MGYNVTLHQELLDSTSSVTDNGTALMKYNSTTNTSLSYAEFEDSRHVRFWMRMMVIPFLSVSGIVGNVFSLAVWQMETSFNVTVFLFKFLGVWDTVYLGIVIIYCYSEFITRLDTPLTFAIWHSGNYAQLVSVHATLFIAISRWIAVTFPFRAQRLLTSCRVYLVCVFILMLCGVIEGCQLIYIGPDHFNKMFYLVKQSVGLILPLLLLVIFNISLLWTATRRHSILSQTETKESQPQTQRQSDRPDSHGSEKLEVYPKGHTNTRREIHAMVHERGDEEQQQQPDQPPQRQHQTRQDHGNKRNANVSDHGQHASGHQSRKRPMVTAVLLVSLCCFISYPIGIGLRNYLMLEANVSAQVEGTLYYLVFACHVVNSSINVFIYWFFMSRFRQLATRLRNYFCAGRLCGDVSGALQC